MRKILFHTIMTKDIILCGYMRDPSKAISFGKYNNYIPILESLSLTEKCDVSFEHKSNKSLNVKPYYTGLNNRKLDVMATNTSTLNINRNDVSLKPSSVFLNFSNDKVEVYDTENYLINSYSNIEQFRLKGYYTDEESYGNMVSDSTNSYVLFTAYRFNNPEVMKKVYGTDKNYIACQLEDIDRAIGSNIDVIAKSRLENTKMLLTKALEVFERCDDSVFPTITIITMTRVPSNLLQESNEDEINAYVLPLKNMMLLKDSIVNFNTEVMTRLSDHNDIKSRLIPGTKFSFIIDKDNVFKKDLYVNSYGRAVKVPRYELFDTIHLDGYYEVYLSHNFEVKSELYKPLSEIKDIKYLFETEEDANNHSKDLDRRLAELSERKLELDKELTVLKAESDKELLKLKSEYEQKKRAIEEEGYRDKHIYEQRKYQYDEKRYKRDYAVEQLKTVVAVAGAISTGMLIYKKLYDSRS